MAAKAFVCPRCNGEIIMDSEQEYGVCKYCRTTVQNDSLLKIKGKVKIDDSEYIANFLANARRAKSKEDWEEVEKYYNLVEQNNPTNIEAIFYSSYGKAMMSLVESDIYKREQKFKVLCNSVSIIDDNFDLKNANRDIDVIETISKDIVKLKNSNYVYNYKTNQYGLVTYSDSTKTKLLFANVLISLIESIENVVAKLDTGNNKRCQNCGYPIEENKEKCSNCNGKINKENIIEVNLFKLYSILVFCIQQINSFPELNTQVKALYLNRLPEIFEKMKKLNPEFIPPQIITQTPTAIPKDNKLTVGKVLLTIFLTNIVTELILIIISALSGFEVSVVVALESVSLWIWIIISITSLLVINENLKKKNKKK